MAMTTRTVEKAAAEFLDDIRQTFKDDLVSVILHGQAAREEFSRDAKISFLVVLDDNTPSEIGRCSKFLKRWRRRNIAVPLFLTKQYIQQSLDTFPLEFMNMASAYEVLHGDDVLADLDLDPVDVRNQCEREIKGKLLHLRSEYLNLRGDTKGIMELVDRSLATFRLLFSGVLFLKKIDSPMKTSDMIDAVIEEYGLDSALFKKLTAVANGEIKIDELEADKLFDLYVDELDKLSDEIDSML